MRNKIGKIFTSIAASLVLSSTAFAQSGIGNGAVQSTVHDMGAGITTFEMPSVASSSAVTGELRSRLPLIDLEKFPLNQKSGTLSNPGTMGAPQVGGQAFGTGASVANWPYTTARTAIVGLPGPGRNLSLHNPTTSVPYRQTGKLLMRFGTQWFVCTASLVKRGVLITAAHCVFTYGQAGSLPNEVRWYPANVTNSFTTAGGPWGFFTALTINVPNPYINGTDTCQAGAVGIVCNNDIATVTLNTRNGNHAGAILGGWYQHSWNGYGFTQSPDFGNQTVGALHQLGYPGAFDGGYQMQRTTSLAKFVEGTGTNGQPLRNFQMGSAQTGGSSGGPWLANFGARPIVNAAEASLGSQNLPNRVVAVTSWGYTQVGINVQGASYFGQNAEFPALNYGTQGAGNIGAIMNATCTANPGHC